MAEKDTKQAEKAPDASKDGEPKQVKRTTLFVQNLPEETDKAMLQQMFGDVGPLRRVTLVTEKGDKKTCKGYAFVTFALEDDAKKAMDSLHGAKILGQKMNVDIAKPRQREGGRKEMEKKKKEKGAAVATVASADSTAAPEFIPLPSAPPAKKEKDAKPAAAPKKTAPVIEKRKFEKPKKVKVEEAPSKRWRLIVRNLSFKASKEEVEAAFKQCGDVQEVLIPKKKDGSGPAGFAFVQLGSKAAAEKAIKTLNGSSKVSGGRPVAVDWALDKKHYLEHLNKKSDGADAAKKESSSDSESSSSAKEDKEKKKKQKMKKETPVKVESSSAESDSSASSSSSSAKEDKKKKQKKDSGDIVIKTEFISDDEEDRKKNKKKQTAEKEKPAVKKEKKVKEQKEKGIDSDKDEASEALEEDEEEKDEKEEDLTNVKVKKEPRQRKPPGADVIEGRTLFIRNLPFIITEEELMERFSAYGPIKYSLLVKRPDTGTPKGSAFIQFETKEAADTCLEEAYPKEKAGANSSKSSISQKIAQRKIGSTANAIQLTELLSEIRVHGRQLIISKAVNRSEAAELSAKQKEKKVDKRNLYLANEGAIDPNSVAAKTMSKSDLEKRARGDEEKKKKLTSPNFFVSRTRLSVRNLPATVDDMALREMFYDAAKSVPGNRPRIVQAKLQKDPERKNKSKGYGFIEFEEHEHALAALRKINNNPEYYGEERRPIVEFAIENVLTLHKRELRNKMMERKRTGADLQHEGEGQGGEGAYQTQKPSWQEKRNNNKRKSNETTEAAAEGEENTNQKKQKRDKKEKSSTAPSPSPRQALQKRPQKATPFQKKNRRDTEDRDDAGGDAEIASVLRQNKQSATNTKMSAVAEKAKKKKPNKKVRAHSQQKRKETQNEDKFQSLLENYKQSLSSSKAATSGWFDLAGKQ